MFRCVSPSVKPPPGINIVQFLPKTKMKCRPKDVYLSEHLWRNKQCSYYNTKAL